MILPRPILFLPILPLNLLIRNSKIQGEKVHILLQISGIYFVIIQSQEQKIVRKLVIQ